LNTFIASVDGSGHATLKDVAVATVANVAGWAGQPVPEEIRNAIKLTIEAYYNQGSEAVSFRSLRDASSSTTATWWPR
jgi:hypothetical protein